MKFLSGVAAALIVALAAPTLAADWPAGPDQLAGTWSLEGLTEGSESCAFQLGVNETLGGWTVDFPASCKRNFPVEPITAWRVNPENGAIVFADAERHTLFEFQRTADGGYVASPEGGPGMTIAKGDPADRRAPTPQEAMTGTWRISALGAAALCAFDLTSDARGRSGTLTMRPGCGNEWRDRGFARWVMHGREISLQDARGREIIAFRRMDTFTFEKQASDDPYSRRGEMMFFGKVFR